MSFRKIRTIALVIATPIAVGALTWWWLPDLDSPDMPAIVPPPVTLSAPEPAVSSPAVTIDETQTTSGDAAPVPVVQRLQDLSPLPLHTVSLQPVKGPGLSLPVDCKIGENCFIQNYVDRGDGPGMKDHQCGEDGYDAHKGVDFAILDQQAMQDGVAVLAAADGVVIGFRDGMKDGHPDITGYKKGGKDCGNSVGVRHANGWITAYCHMKNGGFLVKDGDRVKRGEKLGLVGQSGMADFPHLHFSVQQINTYHDPFAAVPMENDCADRQGSMWTETVQRQLPYRGVEIPWAGFSLSTVTQGDVENGIAALRTAPQQVPALVLYAQATNLDKGQKLRLTIYQPDGAKWVEGGSDAKTRSRARQMKMIGRKGKGKTLMAGSWTGIVEVLDAAGKAVARRIEKLVVKS